MRKFIIAMAAAASLALSTSGASACSGPADLSNGRCLSTGGSGVPADDGLSRKEIILIATGAGLAAVAVSVIIFVAMDGGDAEFQPVFAAPQDGKARIGIRW